MFSYAKRRNFPGRCLTTNPTKGKSTENRGYEEQNCTA
jgi:hypothetical protein